LRLNIGNFGFRTGTRLVPSCVPVLPPPSIFTTSGLTVGGCVLFFQTTFLVPRMIVIYRTLNGLSRDFDASGGLDRDEKLFEHVGG
jgi:hypothetical protein